MFVATARRRVSYDTRSQAEGMPLPDRSGADDIGYETRILANGTYGSARLLGNRQYTVCGGTCLEHNPRPYHNDRWLPVWLRETLRSHHTNASSRLFAATAVHVPLNIFWAQEATQLPYASQELLAEQRAFAHHNTPTKQSRSD
ncbi:hypothetical protein NX059_012244 [Plenodomus lindquistii]|nr:hypothetical protein NX059_012244 [Plenodomus lindquistii]